MIRKVGYLIIAVATIIVSGSGCTTLQVYPGRPLPEKEVAILDQSSYIIKPDNGRAIRINLIDGKKNNMGSWNMSNSWNDSIQSKLLLLPGTHTFNMTYEFGVGAWLVTFDMKAGHTYRIVPDKTIWRHMYTIKVLDMSLGGVPCEDAEIRRDPAYERVP